VSPELARELADLATGSGRQVGVLLDRRGEVQYVVAGSPQRLDMPEFGRFRAGRDRLRGLRLVHVHLHGEPLATDDLTDLSLLALDAVVVVRPGEEEPAIAWAHLLPENAAGRRWEIEDPWPGPGRGPGFDGFIRELEAALGRRSEATGAGEREAAILVHLARPGDPAEAWDMEELKALADSAGLRVADVVVQRRPPDPRTFIGRGRLTDLVVEAMQRRVDLLVFSPALTPAQVRAISDLAEIRVMDRAQLILDIFAQRARTPGGRVQVELAQLRHLLPRLAGTGKAMSRLMGGIGGRGPGETKLEVDRRRITDRIRHLERSLEAHARDRANRRRLRLRTGIPLVAIVGYTNAGKSTLLNTLTHARALAEDRLFATLDPFSRRLRFPRDREVVLTDTVGFLRELPEVLRQAFRATLEELEGADVLLHVVDAASPRRDEQRESVERILRDMDLGGLPRITFYNKADRLADPREAAALARDGAVAGSATARASLIPLLDALELALYGAGGGGPRDRQAN